MGAQDEQMPADVFDRLTTCDPGLAWELCRNIVGFQLLGRDPVTVPFLDEAYHYVPFGVIVKKSKKGTRPNEDKSSYRIVGSMSTLCAPHLDKAPFKQRPERVYDSTFNEKYVYKISGMKNGVKKSIKVKVNGTECFDVSLSMELGKLVLDNRAKELKDAKKLYIIFEVFYAQFVSVSVTIGEQLPGSTYVDTTNRKFAHDTRMPIGFSVQKFPLLSNGCVGFQESSVFDGMREGRWKRVTRLRSDPLPAEPATIGGILGAHRNPNDLLPATPGNRRNDPLPKLPDTSGSDD